MIERMKERLNVHPEIMQERTQRVEHPFGTIQPANDQGYFLRKGLQHVRAEYSLSCFAYNLKRVSNSLSVPHCWVPFARHGGAQTCAPTRIQCQYIFAAQTEQFQMDTH